MNIRPVRAGLFHAEDGRTDIAKLIAAFRNIANAPKDGWKLSRMRPKSGVLNWHVDLPVLTNLFWQSSYGEPQPPEPRARRHSTFRPVPVHNWIIPLKQKATEHRHSERAACSIAHIIALHCCKANRITDVTLARHKGGRSSYNLPPPVCWIPLSQTRQRLDWIVRQTDRQMPFSECGGVRCP
jgi:hypothetical protein